MSKEFEPMSEWKPPVDLLNFAHEPLLSVDVETYDPEIKKAGPGWATKRGHVIGIALATPEWSRYYPVNHDGGGNLDAGQVWAWLADEAKHFKGTLVLMNGVYDLGWLECHGVTFPNAKKLRDIMFIEALLDENRDSYSLKALAKIYNFPSKDEDLLQQALKAYGLKDMGDIWKLPAQFVGLYAEQDARLNLQIYKEQQPLIERDEIHNIIEMEHKLIPILISMRKKGVRIDVEKTQIAAKQLEQKELEIMAAIKKECGLDVQIFAAASVAQAFDAVNVKYERTVTDQPSFTKTWLDAHKHPLAKMISEARRYNKARSSFCEGMVLDHQVNGRIHCEFHPLRSDFGGTVSGRFSSSNPNLQQVPKRDDEIGPLIRSLFLPEEGEEWLSADYSAQEPRITAHYAIKLKKTGSDILLKNYTENPLTDYHQLVADMTGLPRKTAKTLNLALIYGAGEKKIAAMLDMPLGEARGLLNTYHAAAPFVRELSAACSEVAEHRGYLKTLAGRHCRFTMFGPKWPPKGTQWKDIKYYPYLQAIEVYGKNNIKRGFTFKSLNRLIQSSAADQTKAAMINLYAEGIVPLLQVHDELCFSVKDRSEGDKIKEVMESCVKLEVPSIADLQFGKSWGEVA